MLDQFMGAGAIGQVQGVLAFFMGEVVVDPFLLHKTADEVKVIFTVLYAVFPEAVAAAELVFDVGIALFFADFFDQVGDADVLKNTAV